MNNLVCITGGKSSAPFIQAAINKKLNIILFDLDLQAFCRKYSNDFFEISIKVQFCFFCTIFLDKNLKSKSVIYIHPLVNDRTIEMTIENLEKFFSKVGICYMWTDL